VTFQIENKVKLFVEQKYYQNGRAPSASEIQQHFKWTKEELFERLEGILSYQKENYLLDPVHDLLEPKQFILAQMLLNTADRRSLRVKLKEVGVTPVEYDRWKVNPVFANYFRTQVNRRFRNGDTTADLELVKLLEDGDLNGIKYYNEITGRYRTAESLNVAQVLALVMDILVTLVSPDILKSVANQLEEKILRGALAIEVGSEVLETSPVGENVVPSGSNMTLELIRD
jgi:hypothetical protein